VLTTASFDRQNINVQKCAGFLGAGCCMLYTLSIRPSIQQFQMLLRAGTACACLHAATVALPDLSKCLPGETPASHIPLTHAGLTLCHTSLSLMRHSLFVIHVGDTGAFVRLLEDLGVPVIV
jgi:hypothetical protein